MTNGVKVSFRRTIEILKKLFNGFSLLVDWLRKVSHHHPKTIVADFYDAFGVCHHNVDDDVEGERGEDTSNMH